MPAPDLHFIISAPRSGSTWLINALNQHPKIFATEHRLFGNFCELWPNNNGNLAPRITLDAYVRALSVHYQFSEFSESRASFCEDFIAEYINFITEYAKRKTNCEVIIDKVTPYPGTASQVIEQIQKLVPNAKIFKLVRDGRDVLTSGTFDWLLKDGEGTPRFDYFVKKSTTTRLTRFFDDAVIEKWAKMWKSSINSLHAVELASTIRYEQMQQSLPQVLRMIFSTFQLDDTIAERAAESVSFANTSGRSNGTLDPTNKQRKGIVGDWKNFFTFRDAKVFDQIAGGQLISEGYEENNQWMTNLADELDFPQSETDGVGKS